MDVSHHPPAPSQPGRAYIGINVLFIILVTVAVAARFWGRHLKRALLGWDDWSILAALIVYYGQSAFNFWVVARGGLGYHAEEVSKREMENMFQQLFGSQFIYAVQFALIRLSICFLLKRIFIMRWLQNTIWIFIAFNFVWALFVIISALTVCHPVAYNWDLMIPGGHCRNGVKLNTYIVNSVWTILYDASLWSLPQFLVWRLHMPLAAKAGLSFMFALGIFDIIVSIIRITYVVKVNFEDVTYDDYPAQIWTVVEISVAIIVACLPVCRIVIEHLLPVSFLPSSRRYLRTKDSKSTVLFNKSERQLTGEEQHAQDVYSVLDEEIGGLELSKPDPVAVKGERKMKDEGRDVMDETRGDHDGLSYTAEANRASAGDKVAIFDGRREEDLEKGHSIAVQHDVTVTTHGRKVPTVEVL